MRPLASIALVLLTACTSGATPTESGSSGASGGASSAQPAVEDIAGVKVEDRGTVAWEDGVVLRDRRVLRVMAVGVKGPPGPCEGDEAVVVRVVRGSDRDVVVEARQYELADKPSEYSCLGGVRGPQPHEVRLSQPLGGRRVLDASVGAPREVISFDDFPTVQAVPSGYQWRPPTWDDSRRVVTRSWGSRDGSLTLEIGPGKQLQALPAVLKRGVVRGEPATVTRVIMLSCVRWGPAEVTLNLCSRDAGAGDPPLGPDELLAVASAVG